MTPLEFFWACLDILMPVNFVVELIPLIQKSRHFATLTKKIELMATMPFQLCRAKGNPYIMKSGTRATLTNLLNSAKVQPCQ